MKSSGLSIRASSDLAATSLGSTSSHRMFCLSSIGSSFGRSLESKICRAAIPSSRAVIPSSCARCASTRAAVSGVPGVGLTSRLISVSMPPAFAMRSRVLGTSASSARQLAASCCEPGVPISTSFTSGRIPPCSAIWIDTSGLDRARRTSMMAASSGATSPSAASMLTNGLMPPELAICCRISSWEATYQSARVAYSCASAEDLVTSARSAGMASLLARKACVLVLSHARQSTACAAAACVIAIVLLSHVMSGGMPPILAIAT